MADGLAIRVGELDREGRVEVDVVDVAVRQGADLVARVARLVDDSLAFAQPAVAVQVDVVRTRVGRVVHRRPVGEVVELADPVRRGAGVHGGRAQHGVSAERQVLRQDRPDDVRGTGRRGPLKDRPASGNVRHLSSASARKPPTEIAMTHTLHVYRNGLEELASSLSGTERIYAGIRPYGYHAGNRIVLASIEKNEPILRTKVTGPGQKATLSAVIQDGMRAVTIRVNDVDGVGGFVLPNDRVDVLLTRQQERTSGMNDVVIQNARVLAVDQLADDAADRPTVVKAVTLEVDTISAQKIALSASLGSLSLMLRRAGEQVQDATRRVTASDLSNTEMIQAAPEAKRFAKVAVTRGTNRQEYNVATEEGDRRDGGETQAAARR